MPRLTKLRIETELLAGRAVGWKDSSGKNQSIILNTTEQRRLYAFLLQSNVREPKDLPSDFIEGMWAAYSGENHPALEDRSESRDSSVVPNGPWRLYRLETVNFGGINIWNGEPFRYDFDKESLRAEGPNASGKSSLLGAIIWAFTGKRPRDNSSGEAHVAEVVLNSSDQKSGMWPPIAAYPSNVADLNSDPSVSVTLTLMNDDGHECIVSRRLTKVGLFLEITPRIEIPDVFISTGIEMPVRLGELRLSEGQGGLPDAVKQLTGLDEVAVLGSLCEGLSNGAREYASYAKKQDLIGKTEAFKESLVNASKALAPLGRHLSEYTPADAVDAEGPIKKMCDALTAEAAALTLALRQDISETADLTEVSIQRSVVVTIDGLVKYISAGLDGLASWCGLNELEIELNEERASEVQLALRLAKSKIVEALDFHARSIADARFRLKALGAATHLTHGEGRIVDCPLCDQSLKDHPKLRDELAALMSAGSAAQRELSDNIARIHRELFDALPPRLARYVRAADMRAPGVAMRLELHAALGASGRHAGVLPRFSKIFEHALESAPPSRLPDFSIAPEEYKCSEHKDINQTIAFVERAFLAVDDFVANRGLWKDWWGTIATPLVVREDGVDAEKDSLLQYLSRLLLAIEAAQPFAMAAGCLKEAVRKGVEVHVLEQESQRRSQIISALQPLKKISALAEGVARQAISELSTRIERITTAFHMAERLQFRNAQLLKREGVVVHAGFDEDVRVDATLIANTSWLRTTLWAFVFALREEAVEQYGADPLPVWLFDDPQASFDISHRLNWANFVAGLQGQAVPAQTIITTHDEYFLNTLSSASLTGRVAHLTPCHPESGPLAILDGESVERAWTKADRDRQPDSAVVYLQKGRVFIEGMLKAMLVGEGVDIGGFALAALKDRIIELQGRGNSPWDKNCCKTLVGILEKPPIQFLQQSAHTDGYILTFSEAKAVRGLWPNLQRVLIQCFREVREQRLLRGAAAAFHLLPPVVMFPEGHSEILAAKDFSLLGKASAFSGKISEGRLTYEDIEPESTRKVRLARHSAYKLTAHTLEPVARPGDILITQDFGETLPPALVVALVGERVLARRLVVSSTSSEVAVLTANAIDPFYIAPPAVAHKKTIVVKKVVGVLFGFSAEFYAASESEVVPCAGEHDLNLALSSCIGLVEVSGASAQPIALDKQFILVGEKTESTSNLQRMDGRPIIASDSDGNIYFKRLRLGVDGLVILESLDGAGDYPPEVLHLPGFGGRRTIDEVWPVCGVLFERAE